MSRDHVGRVVLIATSAWQLFDQDITRTPVGNHPPTPTAHGQLLRRILDPAAPGQAWLCQDQPNTTVTLEHVPAAQAGPLIDHVERRVAGTLARVRAERLSDAEEFSLIQGLRHRAFVDSARFRAITGPSPTVADELGLPYYVSMDVRFYRVLEKEQLCYLSLAVWSGPPWHERYRPPGCPAPASPSGPLTHPPEQYARGFASIVRAADELFATALRRRDFQIFGKSYRLPVFWVATPADPATDPMRYLRGRWRPTINRLAYEFLRVGDARDSVVSASVLDGEFLTLRRFHRIANKDAPRYLILPGRIRHPASSSLATALATQEDHLAQLVRHLTDLEARASIRLDEVQRDLPIWENSLAVYHAVAERAYILWDGLSTHLPMRKWLKLARVHRAVELLHQILLQGIADLAHLTTLTRECVTTVDEATTDLVDRYDNAITERHCPDQPSGTRAALARSGLIARVRARAEHVADDAVRVRASYDDLLRAIASAFDERRVRESDALQKGSALLGVSLAMVGVVTVLDATVRMKPDENDRSHAMLIGLSVWLEAHIPATAAWISLVLGLVLAASAGWATVWLLRLGILGSRGFRRQYDGGLVSRKSDGVWQFLKDTSTDGMEAFSRHGPRLPDGSPDWGQRDTRLTADFARIWDRAVDTPDTGRHDRISRDIMGLSRQIEQWGLHALLLTERARRMYQYPVPALTTMYRCAVRLKGSFLDLAYVPRINMVAFEEFARALARIGLDHQLASALDTWLFEAEPRTAEEAHRIITETLGIRVDMDEPARQRLRDTIARPYRGVL